MNSQSTRGKPLWGLFLLALGMGELRMRSFYFLAVWVVVFLAAPPSAFAQYNGLNASGGTAMGTYPITSAPANGLIVSGNVGIGTATPAATLDVGGTGAMKVPVGTTAQEPSTPAQGMMRYNSTTGTIEYYNGTAWVSVGTASSALACASSAVGTVCSDGTIYAGLSPDGLVPMYAMPCDVGMSGTYNSCTGTRSTFLWGTYGVYTDRISPNTGKANTLGLIAHYSAYNDGYVIGVPAASACASQTYGGHSDWYLPAESELDVLYVSHTAIGGFDTSGSWYWSSTEASFNAWVERFSDGNQYSFFKYFAFQVRCVRR